MTEKRLKTQYPRSLPSWECGLKLTFGKIKEKVLDVTPFVGVWIEIVFNIRYGSVVFVTPFVGVWIEISFKLAYIKEDGSSLPSWECGLK